jgi:hypothetical protein
MKIQHRLLLSFCLFSILQINSPAQPQKDSISISADGTYIIHTGNSTMTISPKVGGRIASYKLGDYEFLIAKNIQPRTYGATFWPSPQSVWNWPPPAVLDNKPYQSEVNGNLIKAVSGKDTTRGFQFIKEFTPGNNNKVDITYSIINISDDIKKVAPWEISRIHKGGLIFFPAGETPVTRKSFEMTPTETIDGIVWHQSTKEILSGDRLSVSDGSEGWMAFAIDGKLLIKKFEDIKPANFAPNEAEVSIYVSGNTDYIEIELQGKYESINPGNKTVWHVEWLSAEIPANVKIEKGSKELVEFVRGIVK